MASLTDLTIRILAQDLASKGIKDVRDGIQQLKASLALFIDTTKEIYEANVQFEKMAMIMKVATGSIDGANEAMNSARNIAQAMGISISETSQNYAKFIVAAKGSTIEGEKAERVFKALSLAAAGTGMSTQSASFAMKALIQMVSKGKVQSEELRQQLGDHLPGAMQDFADAAGVPIKEFVKLLEAGEITSDILIKVAEVWENKYAAVGQSANQRLEASFNSLKNTINDIYLQMGNTLVPFFNMMFDFAKTLVQTISVVWRLITVAGTSMAATFAQAAVVLEEYWRALKSFKPMDWSAIKIQTKEITKAFEDVNEKETELMAQTLGIMVETEKNKTTLTEEEGKKRRASFKSTAEESADVMAKYAKYEGNTEQELTAKHEIEYQNRLKITKKYWLKKKNDATSNREEINLDKLGKSAIEDLERNHIKNKLHIKAEARAKEAAMRLEELEDEISANKMKLGITEETQRKINLRNELLTIAGLRDVYELRKEALTRYVQIWGKEGEEYQKHLKEQNEAHDKYTKALTDAYKKHVDAIKKLNEEKLSITEGIEEKKRRINEKGMTEEQKHLSNMVRYEELLGKSRAALTQQNYVDADKFAKLAEAVVITLAEGHKKSLSKREELEQQHTQKLKEINDKHSKEAIANIKKIADAEISGYHLEKSHKEKAKELTSEREKQLELEKENAEYATKKKKITEEEENLQSDITMATVRLSEVEQLRLEIKDKQIQMETDQVERLKKINEMQIDPKKVEINIEESALERTRKIIEEITQPAIKTITIKVLDTVSSHSSSSGGGGGYFAGGKVASGVEYKDSVNAMLAKGEWIINNKASAFWGDRVMAAINMPHSAFGQHLQSLLAGNSVNSASPMGTINLQLAGNKPVSVSASASSLAAFMAEIRRSQLLGTA